MKSLFTLTAVAALAATGCATPRNTQLAYADCKVTVVSVAGGQPLKVHHAYERKQPADTRTSEHRLHQPGSCG